MSTPTVQAEVEQRLAALNMLDHAQDEGDELELLAATMNAEAALHHLVRSKQLHRLHEDTGPAPEWDADWREDDVLPVPEQPEPAVRTPPKVRCTLSGCNSFKALDMDGRCRHHPQ